jgi:hypothetical protein
MELGGIEGFATLEPPPPTVTVLFNGNDVTNRTQEVVIGQQINLGVSVDTGTISSVSWRVPGMATGGWSADDSSASEADTHFDQTPTSFYWVDAGTSRTVTVNLHLSGGPEVSASTTFHIRAPSGWMLATAKPETSITVDTDCTALTGIWAHYGCRTPYSSSAVYVSNFYSAPSGFSGSFQWVQAGSLSVSQTTSTGTVQSASCTGLDTAYPYSTASSTSDSPASFLPITYRDVQRGDSFTMTLMFQPSSASAIYVPIASVGWSWSVHATSSDGGETWALAGRRAAGTLVPRVSTAFPTWASNISNCEPQ